MPDWNYRPIFKPILDLFPEQESQQMTLWGVQTLGSNLIGRKSIDLMGHMQPPEELDFQIGNLRFLSRVFLGVEIDPQGLGQKAFAKFGFGALEMKFDVAIKSLSENVLPIPIIPVLETSDLDASDFKRMADRVKCFRFSESVTQNLLEFGLEKRLQFFTKLQKITQENQLEFIFTSPRASNREDFLQLLQLLKEFKFKWLQLVAEKNAESTFEFINIIKQQQFFKIILAGGVSCPADYEKWRRHGVDVVCLDQTIYEIGPGLPKRLNHSEEFFRPQNKNIDLESRPSPRMSWFWCFLMGFGMFMGSIMALVVSKTNVLFAYDESLSGITKTQIAAFNEKLLHFMAHDRATLAGTMFSIGILYMSFSWFGAKRGLHWYREAVLISAFMGFLNFFCFLSYGYFDVFHAFVTACLFQIFLLAVYAYFPKQRQIPQPMMTNSLQWKSALIAQLLFVIQGFGLILAGLVITYFGSTTVFVPEDLDYLGMSIEAIKGLHSNLIPLIAHDRCTFGGMLVSSGVLIALSALWGFEPRQRWLWWTYLISGFPAYLITLGIHSHIGYESFIHLLPVFIGMGLLVCSLILSFPYFFTTSEKA